MDAIGTLDKETKKPLPTRIGNAADARTVIGTLKQAEELRSERRRKMQGLLYGNRPYVQQTLTDKGQGDRTNLNLREGEGMVDAAKTPYYSIVFEAPRFANIYTDYGDPRQRAEWNEIISDEFHIMLDAWDGFDYNTQLMQWQMCVFGVGIAMWEDARDWRWKARKIGDFLVPDDAEADIDELETSVVPRSYLPGKLYRIIKKAEAAGSTNWNFDAAKKAIINAADQKSREAYGNNWGEYEQEIERCGDVGWNARSQRIFVDDLFQEELSGKISHYIVLTEDNTDSKFDKDSPKQFLYQKRGKFDSFSQIACPFFFDIGTGPWHSVKGLGPKIYDFCEVSNRMTCDLIDAARRGAGLLLQAGSADAMQKLQLIPLAGGTLIPPDVTVQQNKIAESLQGPLAVKRDLQNILQSNTGQYRERVSAENQEPTLGQAQLNAADQAKLNKGAMDRYMKSSDRMYREMARRSFASDLTEDDPGGKEAHEMRERIIERGVPEEAIEWKNICKVKAVRTVGYGSANMKTQISNEIVGMLPTMDERSRNTALRMWASARGGQTLADDLYPKYDEPQLSDDHVALATLENNDLKQMGAELTVTPIQDDVIHFQIHFQSCASHIERFKQGQADPMQVLIHLEQAGPHMSSHLQNVEGDETRKEQVKGMNEAIESLGAIADQLKQQIEEANQSQQEQEPQIDPKLIAALAKVQGDLKLKEMKLMGDMGLKQAKWEQQKVLKDMQTAHALRLKTLKANEPKPEMAAA